ATSSLDRRFEDARFRNVPSCRGGLMLQILSSMSDRQSGVNDLLLFGGEDISAAIKEDFDYEFLRTADRDDLIERLILQGFLGKCDDRYYMTVKGLARKEYYLAKYTVPESLDPTKVLDSCQVQQGRIASVKAA